MLKTNIIDTKYIGDDGRIKQLCIIDPESTIDISINSKDIVSAGSIKKLIEAIGPHTPEYDPTEINKRVDAIESSINAVTDTLNSTSNDVNSIKTKTDKFIIQSDNSLKIAGTSGKQIRLCTKDYALIIPGNDNYGLMQNGNAKLNEITFSALHPNSTTGIQILRTTDRGYSTAAYLCPGKLIENESNYPVLKIPGYNYSIIDSAANIRGEEIKGSNIKCIYTTTTEYLNVNNTSNFKGQILANAGLSTGMITMINGNGPSFNGMQCGMTSQGLIQTNCLYTNVITNGSSEKKAYLTDGTTAALPNMSNIEANVAALTSRVSTLEKNSSSSDSSSSNSFDSLTINSNKGLIQFKNNTFSECDLPGRRALNILQSTYIGNGPSGQESTDEYKSYFLYVDQPTYIHDLTVGSISGASFSTIKGLYQITPPSNKGLQVDGKLQVDGISNFNDSVDIYGYLYNENDFGATRCVNGGYLISTTLDDLNRVELRGDVIYIGRGKSATRIIFFDGTSKDSNGKPQCYQLNISKAKELGVLDAVTFENYITYDTN